VQVVDAIRKLVPTLRAQIPPSVNLNVVFDRSSVIRTAVADVQLTLLLAVLLVVLVIYLFLGDARATLIPALALPVSLIGTCAVMYLLGYSIDNLSLLALTLSVGFIVDDAIVMLENIVRHVEHGETPMRAALRGSREIAFTIASITLSLVAVFIPVLFMGGILGRLFREFGVTISVTILISGLVSLTLTPMLASRWLRTRDRERRPPGRLVAAFDRAFARLAGAYERSLTTVMRHRRLTLAVTLASLVASAALFVLIPKGFFPISDNGRLFVSTEATESVSFHRMVELQKQVQDIVMADPAVHTVNSTIGGGFQGGGFNQGRLFVGLKPFGERPDIQTVIQRLRAKLARLTEVKSFIQPIQDIHVGGHLSKSLYQYTLQGTDFDEVKRWAPRLEAAMRTLPGLQDVTSDLQIGSPQAKVEIDRQRAAALGVTQQAVRQPFTPPTAPTRWQRCTRPRTTSR
jgi:Cation/multidrug efflux pump